MYKSGSALKAGDFLMLEYGSYSDQAHFGPFLILKDFNLFDVTKKEYEIKKANFCLWKRQKELEYAPADVPGKEYENNPGWLSPFDLPAFLTREGYIADLPNRTIYMGEGGFEFEEEPVTDIQ